MTPRPNGRALSKELAKLAAEVHTTTADGTALTKEQVLSDLIWKQALGWEEIVKDEFGKLSKKLHPPVAWCQQFLFERIDGKAPVAAPDNSGGMRAAERVSELAKDRINQLAAVSAGPPKRK